MVVLYAGESLQCDCEGKILFLAGPTTRRENPSREELTSWRADALNILQRLNFQGVVCIPEPYTGAHDAQVSWEQEWLKKATTIIFWIDRRYQIGQYATTTNLEFGQYIGQGEPKVVYGRPTDADAIKSNDWHAENNNVKIFEDISALLQYAISL